MRYFYNECLFVYNRLFKIGFEVFTVVGGSKDLWNFGNLYTTTWHCISEDCCLHPFKM